MSARVLIVEDELISAEYMSLVLRGGGFEVLEPVSGGREAVEAAVNLRPDIVLMDIMLPGDMNGIEAAAKITEIDIPVIFITANSNESVMKVALDATPYGFLLKPINPREMIATINLTINRHELARELRRKEAELRESEHRYGSLINSASDTIWTTDIEGNFTFVNPATELVTGYSRDELLGKNVFSLIDSSQGNSLRGEHAAQLRQRTNEVYTEVRVWTKDGKAVWLGQHVQLFWKDDRIAGFQAIGRDITGTKRKEQEMEIARTVQDAIMGGPVPPDCISFFYRPMREIGGDIIDLVDFREPGKTGVFIGDVSGHGVPAALVAAMVKGIISQSGNERLDPSGFLEYLNDGMYDKTGGYFITALYGIYTHATGHFVFSSAGHEFPLVVTADGVISVGQGSGVPLGIMTSEDLHDFNKRYQSREITVPEEGKLLVYTDGLSEACGRDDPSVQFGAGSMGEAVKGNRHLRGRAFLEGIFRDAVEFHGQDSFEDDITMAVLERE